MSTEAVPNGQMDKKESKKRKKDKDSSHSSSKKRKPNEAEAAEDAVKSPALETPKKKHKRHPDDLKDDHVEQSTIKKSDKKKHKRKSSKDEPIVSNITAPASEDLLRTHSPFVTQTTSFYLALSPCAQKFPIDGLCAEHISPLLLTYYAPLHGVVLSYSNPRVSERPTDAVETNPDDSHVHALARSINEYAVSYIWLTADFVLFRPQRGRWLEGYVSLQNESLLGLMCYNYFNAIIPREKLPKDWKWEGEVDGKRSTSTKKIRQNVHDESGYFVNGQGEKVEGRILFRVDDFDATAGTDGAGGTVSISGTLRTEDDET